MSNVRFMDYDVDFYDCVENSERQLVIYGAGAIAQRVYPYLPKVDYICDKKAETGEHYFDGIKVIAPKQLEQVESSIIILICIKDKEIRDEVKKELFQLSMDAYVFDIYESASFPLYHPQVREMGVKELKRVRIINYDKEGWILSKFSNKLKECLLEMGIDADVGDCIDPEADINHHVQFGYEPLCAYHDTIMISHVVSQNLLEKVKHQLQKAEMGICMSKDMMDTLVKWGVPRCKLCYINPAHDIEMKPKKYVLGTTHRCYENQDYRKRDGAIVDVCREIDPRFFEFKIMGAGWDRIVKDMRSMGFEVEYYREFDRDIYQNLISSLDYYFYQGYDEGSMGILDALTSGVKTIVTPQGFHLDIKNGITHECRTVKDFVDVLKEIEQDKKKRIESVADWTWDNYAKKHVEVWKYILGNTEGVFDNMHLYEDGIFSVLRLDA